MFALLASVWLRASSRLTYTSDKFDHHFLVANMFIPLLRTPLARYVPLKASSQLTRRVSPISAALTRSFAAATETKAKKVAPAKANRGKQSKADAKKKNSELKTSFWCSFILVDFCSFASLEKLSPPRHPINSFIRFSAHYHQTHEIKQPIAMTAGDIKRAYEALTPEEKEVCSAVDYFFSNLLNNGRFFYASLRNSFPPNKN
jgi:hypothetical protein